MVPEFLWRLFLSEAAVAAASLMLGTSRSFLMGSLPVLFYLCGGSKVARIAYHTLGRDVTALSRLFKLKMDCNRKQWNNDTVPRSFRKMVQKYGDSKTAINFEGKLWTFGDLDRYSNKVANYLLNEGYKPKDCIAVFMENRMEYVGVWLGCAKIGVVPALINCNLRERPLLHSLEIADAVGCIFATDTASAMQDIAKDVSNMRLYCVGQMENTRVTLPPRFAVNMDRELENASDAEVPESVEACVNVDDKLLYIYTSGTTGMPKASIIKHNRFHFYGLAMFYMNGMGSIEDPVFYNPLPLYHSAGGIVGVGMMMNFGATIVLRRKFSASNFWKDCCKYNCTVAQYIGEICRYLLNQPEAPEEKSHNVQLMFGNGLRPTLWKEFSSRFSIARIGEFYGSTEGNSNIVNTESKPGAVGFKSVLFQDAYPVSLVRVCMETGELLRDPKTGLCIPCLPGEPGEFVGRIEVNHPSRNFDGYLDAKATEKKKALDVMKKGDMWFRSGDLLRMDEFGWMYFVDRMGDTFRWKGENVSTAEVEAVLSDALQQQDVIVYGVEVQGAEGRAGMAALVAPEKGFDLKEFSKKVTKGLASYARPLFLRIVKEMDMTGTFKHKKMTLQKESFNPNVISDPLFFFDQTLGSYRALDSDTYSGILSMTVRF